MADTKKSRDKQARDADDRQRERELKVARERADETEPPRDAAEAAEEDRREGDDFQEAPRTCHRRGCEESATFVVLERYQEETGQGAVEAEAFLCEEHTDEESPTNLDSDYPGYVFRVVPIPEADATTTA